MMKIDWSTAKITLTEFELFLKGYIPSVYDGCLLENNRLTIVTTEDLSQAQQDYIEDYYFKVNNKPRDVSIASAPSFGAKTFYQDGVLKKLFARFTGQVFELDVGNNVLDFAIPYAWVKMVGLELIGGEIGDIASLKVLDSPEGIYSGIPNFLLNQFGFDVAVAKDFYTRQSQFDSDLYLGMIIRIEYNSISAKTVYFNYLINEVK